MLPKTALRLAFAFLSTTFSWRVADGADPEIDRSKVRDALKSSWASIESLDCQAEIYLLDPAGRPDRSRNVIRIDFAHAPGGRWALRHSTLKPDGGETIQEDVREDGRRRNSIRYLKERSGWIHTVHIKAQESRSDRYVGTMNVLTWLLLPRGRPPVYYATDSASLSESARTISLASVDDRGHAIRILFDTDHDWLARRVELGPPSGSATQYWEAARFQYEDGRWFPAEGTFLAASAGDAKRGFAVTRVAINRPIDPARFALPSLPDGVFVQDDTTDERTTKGGDAAGKRYQDRFLRSNPDVKAPTPAQEKPIRVRRDAGQFPWSAALAFASILALIAAVGIKIRRRVE